MTIEEFSNIQQYSINKEEKKQLFLPLINKLHLHHLESSVDYRKISDKLFGVTKEVDSIDKLPFLPVSLFKERKLKSIPNDKVYKTLTSSGTTGSIPSQIILDINTANLQSLALSKIITRAIGKERLPMIIVDSLSVIKNRTAYSARGAGILGLSLFGKNHFYLLDENYQVQKNKLKTFVEQFNGKPILIFGFTFMIWEFLYLFKYDFNVDFSNAFLIHSGGWKKMSELAVDNEIFKNQLYHKFGIKKENIINFYGMVEQVGSIFLENKKGYLNCPNFSEIIIRDPIDFSVLPHGKEGIIQLISILPYSYPGHSILTEDIGIIVGEDNDTEWNGKYFKILGRIKKTEIRGCSDTYSQ
jgi:hypothetical protein